MSEASSRESPDFTRPIAVLKACHERMRAECDTLRGLLEHVQKNGSDEQARETAGSVIRYFDTAARIHHDDEEEDLLPRMMAASTMSRGSSLTRMIADIATEHREMDRAWTELRAGLQDIIGRQNRLDALQVDRYVKLLRSHIAMEESNVFPLAEMLLSRQDLADIGASMAQRRGDAPA